jgi:hypothetical protein
MGFSTKLFLLGALPLCPLAAQSDLGTGTNGGALTDGRVPDRDHLIRLQLKELATYRAGIEQLLKSTVAEMSQQYGTARRDRVTTESPLDFLARKLADPSNRLRTGALSKGQAKKLKEDVNKAKTRLKDSRNPQPKTQKTGAFVPQPHVRNSVPFG